MAGSSSLGRLVRATACAATLVLVATLAPAATAAPREKPAVGECFNAAGKALAGMSLDATPVDCARPHTLETYRVATWKFANPYEMDEATLGRRAEELCAPSKANRYLGIPATRTPFSRSYWYFFFPTEQQWAEGDRWLRCDVALQRGWEGVQVVSGPMADLIAEQGVYAWAWCTKARPKKVDQQAPAPCASSRAPWLLVASVQLKGAAYPGFERAKKQAAAWCAGLAPREARVSDPDWHVWWSSEEEWQRDRAGFAWCYMPWSESRWR